MKSCPTCNKTFVDPNLSFCIDDGTPLVQDSAPADETTGVSSSSGGIDDKVPPPTEVYQPRDWQAPDYQPPGFHSSTAVPGRRKAWPWVVGLLAALVIGLIGIGIAGAIFVPRMLRNATNQNSPNANVERNRDANSNLNSNGSVSESENSSAPMDEDDVTPPTDKDVVLAALTDLENEWTVANINADKQKLDRILADDYVGVSTEDGKVQGKADYLRTITRDTTIQNWKFEDLRVNLMRDRATLEGVLRLQLPDQETAFRFTDKFVWRDGRWKAVGSEVSQIK